MSLKEILIEAVKMNTNQGSSTAVLASLVEPNIMKTTNLGDSGYVIYSASLESDEQNDSSPVVRLTKTFRSEE